MKKKEFNLIEDPVDLRILSNIDGKKNITDISIITGYTYKSVFHRIKKLQTEGFVELHKTKDITKGAILTIPKKIEDMIEHELKRYKFAEDELISLLSDKSTEKELMDILKFIQENRFVSNHDINSFLYEQYNKDIEKIIKILHLYELCIDCGFLRSRVEITRAGKKIIKLNI
jgi:ADP-glucose pyrophosphorylase